MQFEIDLVQNEKEKDAIAVHVRLVRDIHIFSFITLCRYAIRA